ncbi:leucine--tRNA ligase [Cardinium endosymbiont of Oedothorax gibbosus]|uniref:leucine--tRNA ligase n=1 Tax=Cardinium endosymbiont of Oedothorax gibbosus TaxID=931101 RepID=UPI0020240F11|nr:leucine--tRNA ligase [Cardinium endosymbiont of Oedothorax gibbosus]CAH2559948.1 Leucine--tRNA ligase [Cardinium endosymbiont of Oedothorax gibbosus]
MQPYIFTEIEKKWQNRWKAQKSIIDSRSLTTKNVPKYYILNMFPYPSAEGLHVGHYVGYVASDILSRYYKHSGYRVMNPMGFDAFGLPAEQHAIQTGQHPAITTAKNIEKYIVQLKQVALDFDWDRSINTSEPAYYKWTQWIFLQMFNAWYNTAIQKAAPIDTLIQEFTFHGSTKVQAACDDHTPIFSAEEWNAFTETEKQTKLLHYRLAYLKDSMVNWCEALGTVLANEEVKDGFSQRGGYPVTRKKMKQWSLRMTAYAERLLTDLEALDWPLSTKEMQRNWLGKSQGAEITFRVQGQRGETITVFTTRPETIFGACFIALAPEHPWASFIAQQTGDVELIAYIEQAKNRLERSRLAETTFLSGVFVGACVIHPFTGSPLPIWVADYVLPSYGRGVIMGVPAHDKRDYIFAQSFDLLILPVIESTILIKDGPYETPKGRMINSDFLNGLSVPEAVEKVMQQLTQKTVGRYKVNYRLQDPIFSRQRYWGEPFPIYYKEDGLPYALSEDQLPLVLPEVSSYQPNKSGAPPLGNASSWSTPEGYPLDLYTMPGWAGSSWYFLRYMDPHNTEAFLSKEKEAYWKGVDFYIGGAEHATGHLLYACFWTKLLYDLGHIDISEPFPKLFHQGLIQKPTAIAYRLKDQNIFLSAGLISEYDVIPIYIPTAFVEKDILDLKALKNWRPEFADARFLLEGGKYICGSKMEKMSKSKYNVVDPDKVIAQYGADALRLYLMFLGPLEQSKPWDLSGIEGVFRFLNKVWRFVHHAKASWATTELLPHQEMLKVIHKTIKKVTESIQKCSFNTAISSLMIGLNRLSTFERVTQSIVADFILLLEPFAPYMAAELWESIDKTDSITEVAFPLWNEAYLEEKSFEYPIAVNGKVRTKMVFGCNASSMAIEKAVLANEVIQKWVIGKSPKNVVIVLNKMVNVVV